MKSISRRTTLKGIAAAGLAGAGAGLLPRGARAAETTWELYTYYPVATGTTGRGMLKIAEDTDKATNGQLKIKVHLGGSLPIQAASITPAVANNVVQIAGDIFAVGNIPILGVLRLPMLVHNVEEFEAANKVALPYIVEAYDKKGVTVLGRYSNGARLVAHFSGLALGSPRPEVRLNGEAASLRLDLVKQELWLAKRGTPEQIGRASGRERV